MKLFCLVLNTYTHKCVLCSVKIKIVCVGSQKVILNETKMESRQVTSYYYLKVLTSQGNNGIIMLVGAN